MGIDVASIDRFSNLLVRHGGRFARRWFTASEMEECGLDAARLAARFAAKEAVWKALGIDSGGAATWRSVEVFRNHGTLRARILPPLASPPEVTSIAVDVVIRGSAAVAIAIATTG